jgi:histidine triad (HIT) family protein
MMTIFEHIICREIPAHILHEDDLCIAFLDIKPVAYGHTLVVPKHPYVRLDQCPDDLVAHLFVVSKKLMLAMKQALGADFVHIGVMGTEVPHTHIHVIPLQFDTSLTHRSTLTYDDQNQAQQYAHNIQQSLQKIA